MFVIKGSSKLTVPPNRKDLIKVGSRSVVLRRVFDLKVSEIHLTQVILKVWIINGHYIIDVSIGEGELRC